MFVLNAQSATIDISGRNLYLCGVEVHFSADKEARLLQVATRTGKDASQLIEEAVDRMLEYDASFIEAVEQGRASARRGDLLDHDEVVERIEQILRP
jgi:predicted transcriptional regulator